MNMVELARMIGKEIQKDEDYIALKSAEQACESDTVLQDLIGQFNLKRMAINQESSKKEKDNEKIARMNQELREYYSKIMSNENMSAYNQYKTALEAKVQEVVEIITQCAEGADPDTVEGVHACGGDCSGCSGCH